MDLIRLRLQAVTPAAGSRSRLNSVLQALVISVCGSGVKDLRKVDAHIGVLLYFSSLWDSSAHLGDPGCPKMLYLPWFQWPKRQQSFFFRVSAITLSLPLDKATKEQKHSAWKTCSSFSFPISACFYSDSWVLRQLFVLFCPEYIDVTCRKISFLRAPSSLKAETSLKPPLASLSWVDCPSLLIFSSCLPFSSCSAFPEACCCDPCYILVSFSGAFLILSY